MGLPSIRRLSVLFLVRICQRSDDPPMIAYSEDQQKVAAAVGELERVYFPRYEAIRDLAHFCFLDGTAHGRSRAACDG